MEHLTVRSVTPVAWVPEIPAIKVSSVTHVAWLRESQKVSMPLTSYGMFVAQVNKATNTVIQARDLAPDLPVSVVGVYNTTVRLKPSNTYPYTGYKDISYNRIELKDVFPAHETDTIYPTFTGITTSHAAVSIMNAAYGVNLAAGDLVLESLDFTGNEVWITSAANNYLFLAGTKYRLNRKPLSSLFTQGSLDGF